MHIQRQSEAFAFRIAAVPRTAADLVKKYTDQLYKEFHDWLDTERGGEWPVGTTRPTDYTQPMGGPLTYWDNIEEFMKERYPAAYRGYRYGQEQAACALDGYGMTFPIRERTVPYETGPEAVEKYGYDPKQVAAGFMYLHSTVHNKARPTSRTNRIPRDIDRLSDIFQKRVDMQEQARQRKLLNANTIRCAMPRQDAYSSFWDGDRQTEEPTYPPDQKWYHRSDHDLPAGTILTPGGGKSKWEQAYKDRGEPVNDQDWVWMTSPEQTDFSEDTGDDFGKHLYEIQPLDEGPYPWNNLPFEHVAPRARIIRKVDPRAAWSEFSRTFKKNASKSLSSNTIRCASITVPVGSQWLHCTPSYKIVDAVQKAGVPVHLSTHDHEPVSADSLLNILGLGAFQGDPVTVHCDDENVAAAIAKIIETNHDLNRQ